MCVYVCVFVCVYALAGTLEQPRRGYEYQEKRGCLQGTEPSSNSLSTVGEGESGPHHRRQAPPSKSHAMGATHACSRASTARVWLLRGWRSQPWRRVCRSHRRNTAALQTSEMKDIQKRLVVQTYGGAFSFHMLTTGIHLLAACAML